MREGSIVEKTIHLLKQRLEKGNGLIEVYLSEGNIDQVTCTFNNPATQQEIESFEKETGFILSEDYKKFLLITNGCRLFDHPYYGGESYIYDLDTITEYYYEEPFEGCFTIGYIYQDNIVINTDRYKKGEKNYLMVKSSIEQFKEGRILNMNFELWFDRFVISQGSKFWEWSIYTAENYYRLR